MMIKELFKIECSEAEAKFGAAAYLGKVDLSRINLFRVDMQKIKAINLKLKELPESWSREIALSVLEV